MHCSTTSATTDFLFFIFDDTSPLAGTHASTPSGPIGTLESFSFPGLLFPPNRETQDRSESLRKTTVSMKLSKKQASGRDEVSLQESIQSLEQENS